MTKYIGVLSGKGGVGKTTVAINLTTALSLLGRDVILCDADLTKANVSLHLGAHRFKTTLHEVLWQQATIQSAIYYHQSGIRFIPGGISSYHAKNTNPEMIKGLKSHGDGLAEAIILDGPVSDAKTVNAFLSLLDELILVTTPDLPALTDTLRVLHLAEQHKITILGVVINRIHFNEFELEKDNIQAMLGLPVLGEIPEHVSVRAALKNEKPLVSHDPSCEVSKAFKKLASLIIGEEYHAIVK